SSVFDFDCLKALGPHFRGDDGIFGGGDAAPGRRGHRGSGPEHGATGDNMTDWYYHDPAQGRVGPLSAEQVRARYVDRRIQRDTLAWHAGVREWQPLDRFSDELQLDTVAPDASQPPPLPPAAPP